jgi:hypothetical protein
VYFAVAPSSFRAAVAVADLLTNQTAEQSAADLLAQVVATAAEPVAHLPVPTAAVPPVEQPGIQAPAVKVHRERVARVSRVPEVAAVAAAAERTSILGLTNSNNPAAAAAALACWGKVHRERVAPPAPKFRGGRYRLAGRVAAAAILAEWAALALEALAASMAAAVAAAPPKKMSIRLKFITDPALKAA